MTKNVGQVGTHHLNPKVVQNAFRAFDYAADTDRKLQLYVVLHFQETPEMCATTIFKKVRHKYRDWLVYKNRQLGRRMTPDYMATFENPSEATPHANWVLSLPAEFHNEFERKLPQWLERAQKAPVRPFDIKITKINEGTEKTLAKYVLKGVNPAYVEHFYLEKVYEENGPQGHVVGRRAVISRSLGMRARQATGWRPRPRRTKGQRANV
jgi:hypothetical protein